MDIDDDDKPIVEVDGDVESPVKATTMVLSPEQQFALQEFEKGKNIFLTGPGGSGKTELIKRLVASATKAGKVAQVCALTGCAALLLNCGAKTIHSWAGIGLATQPIHEIEYKVMNNKRTVKKWRETDVLIIDEISMMAQRLFEILDDIGRRTRKEYSRPFGGLQLVMSGDFYQLPPVSKQNLNDPTAGAFCFESPRWPTTFQTVVQLCKIFRQADPVYASILNQVRVGKLYRTGYDLLMQQVGRAIEATNTFKPTKLYPRHKEVDELNRAEYSALQGPEYKFCISKPALDKLMLSNLDKAAAKNASSSQQTFEFDYLSNNLMVEKELCLKVGTQVMCVANLSDLIVNGSQGVVVGFQSNAAHLPIVQFNSGLTEVIDYNIWQSETLKSVAIAQIPLIYAWGITILKAQGSSLDVAEIDAGSGIFECGQTYVALSRIKSLQGLYLKAFDPQKIRSNAKVDAFYKSLAIK